MGIDEKVTGSFSLTPVRCQRMGYPALGSTFTDQELEECVNGFSAEKFIGKFQFGEVYSGTYEGEDVIVKIWKKQDRYDVLPGENEGRFVDELLLHEYFQQYEFHPNVVKLWKDCDGPKNLAAIYHPKPKAIDTLHNLIEKDTFTWAQRIKVAFGFASLLRYMHTPHPNCPSYVPYLIRNIDAAHILVDQDHEALLFDFSMISGGILTDKRELVNQRIHGCDGYADPICARPGKWSDRCDVFSYGVVLLSLISKRVYKGDGDSYVYKWAKDEHNKQNSVASGKLESLLVHNSLKSDPDFNFDDAETITNLAIKCIKDNPQKRPTMKQVVKKMQELHIVQQNANTWECCQMLDGVNEISEAAKYRKGNREKEYWQRSKWHWGLPYNNRMRKIKGLGQSRASSKYSIGKDDVIRVFAYEALNKATGGFSKANFIGKFQFGKVFRGETTEGKKVTVKIWETIGDHGVYRTGNEDRLRDEISLLQHPELLSHPNVVKMIGYCFEEGKLGVVYDLDPQDSLHNLAPKDKFSWLQRMKVIYEFANLLDYLHTPNPPHVPYRVGNIDAAHIVLDKAYSPKLLDFGMTVGGIILSSRKSRNKYVHDPYGYMDPAKDVFYEARDVFAFGCIIMCLIHKRVPTLEDMFKEDRFLPILLRDWEFFCGNSVSTCERVSYGNSVSYVHKSLEQERGFNENDGVEVTKLGFDCIGHPYNRPSMEDVVKRLQKLHVIRKMGIHKLY